MWIATYKSIQVRGTKVYLAVGTFEGFARTEVMDQMKADGFTEAQLARAYPRILVEKMRPAAGNGHNAWGMRETLLVAHS